MTRRSTSRTRSPPIARRPARSSSRTSRRRGAAAGASLDVGARAPGSGSRSSSARAIARALDVLSLRCGLYAAEALDALADAPIGVKWPNDLYVGGRKLAGVLIETRWRGARAGLGRDRLRPERAPPRRRHRRRSRAGYDAHATRSSRLVPALRRAARATGHLTDDELSRWSARDVARGRVAHRAGRGPRRWISRRGASCSSRREPLVP